MSHSVRHIEGIGHQVLKREPDGKMKVVGTYDDKDEADDRFEQELQKAMKEHEQKNWKN